MTVLFDEKQRVDVDPSHHNENTFNYYDRSARKDVSNIRQLLNKWYLGYPVNEQIELKSRFKKTFSSAFYELFIYQLFKHQGFEIEIHPEIPNSNKRPDFLLKKETVEFYLEAKEARDKSKEEEASENRNNQVYDSLNKIKSPNFFLKIDELVLKITRQPSIKKAIEKIETEVANYDPDALMEQLTKYGLDNGAKIEYESDDLKLIISLIPKIPSARNLNEGRPIGMYPIESFWGGSEESIKDSFTKKSKRYGMLDKPYFICINAIGIKGEGDFDVEGALWGSLASTWSTDPNNKNERMERQRDGIFLDKTRPRCKNVTGVLVTKVMEFNIHVARHWFALHPFTDIPFEFSLFNLTHNYIGNGQVQKVSKQTIGEVLKMNSTWLDD